MGIKSLIITDIDYRKEEICKADICNSESTNDTIKHFYSLNHSKESPSVANLYAWKAAKGNIFDGLINICFQTDKDGYARTLEEAMLNRYFSMDVSTMFKKKDWKKKRKDSKLKFSIPRKKGKQIVSDDDIISIRDILESTSGNKIDFMYSVIMNGYVEMMIPEYIDRGLTWLME